MDFLNDLREALHPRVEEISFHDNTYYDEGFFADSISEGFAGWYDEKQLALQIDFILKSCEVQPCSRILDVACGHGRHADLLSQQGHEVVGTDISQSLINHLRKKHGPAIRFEKRSFAEIDFVSSFDLVLALGNSLSLIRREELPAALGKMGAALRKGGQFFIEMDNRPHFVQNVAGTRPWAVHGDRWVVFSEHYYDESNKLEKTRDVSVDLRDMKVRRFLMTKSLYNHAEIADALARVGMAVTGSWGDWDRSAIHEESPSLLIVGLKEP